MIGRRKEVLELNNLYNGNEAELIAVYGRIRVGKTYLIDETFGQRITFRHAGLSPIENSETGMLKKQLEHFYNSLLLQGMEKSKKPDTWLEAFFLLEKYLQDIDDGSRQLVFLDELPWMDTPRSGFITAFESFWNTWGCHRKNLMVIVCGSANSWIQDKLINNHGGLYNRITYELKLSPFTLNECEEFYKSRDISLSRYDMVQGYMIFGGVPYYLGYIKRGMSLAQNIDELFFFKNGKLKNEYDRLFASVFTNPETVKNIVELLSKRSIGFTRKEIVKELGISDGGNLSLYLNSLIASDFVIKYVPFGFSKREEHYKLIDQFCIFYLQFLNGNKQVSEHYWQENFASQAISSWRGFAFENVCFNHLEQIKKALGISGVSCTSSAWALRGNNEAGMQIDMLISRKDNVINMCEMKYYSGEYVVDKDNYQVLLSRQEKLLGMVSPKIAIHNTLITTFGVKKNEYSNVFNNVITVDDLFN